MKVLVMVEAADVIGRISTILQRGSLRLAETAPKYAYDLKICPADEFAIETVEREHPDLILLDVRLKSPSAKDICAFVRSRDAERHTGVVFLGGATDRVDLSVECLELGADDYFRMDITDREFLARINAVLRLKAMTDDLRSANHRLQLLSNTDELTGLHNMRSFNQMYSHHIRAVREGKCGIGVIMIDLDHFKRVNDSANHLIGSYVIGEVGKLIRCAGILGADDCAARYGGDEYVIFTKDRAIEETLAKAENIHALIGKAAFIRDGFSVKLTASIGVSWTGPAYAGKDEDPIKAADMMLYKSKRNGRDQVQRAELDHPGEVERMAKTHLKESEGDDDEKYVARIYSF